MRPLELYIHIPFCVKKCRYCDFLSAPASAEERQKYVTDLCRKIRSYEGLAGKYLIRSIFLGGGHRRSWMRGRFVIYLMQSAGHFRSVLMQRFLLK